MTNLDRVLVLTLAVVGVWLYGGLVRYDQMQREAEHREHVAAEAWRATEIARASLDRLVNYVGPAESALSICLRTDAVLAEALEYRDFLTETEDD